jgi:uncharacterized membrane protein YoaK (UPF0700 family)
VAARRKRPNSRCRPSPVVNAAINSAYSISSGTPTTYIHQGGASKRKDAEGRLRAGGVLGMKTLSDEYLPLRWRDAAWVCYLPFFCGCVNGASVRGLFQVPSTHFTGYMIRTAISVAGGEESVGWLTNSGPGYYPGLLVSTTLGCGIGAFVAGLTLACKSEDGSYTSIRLNHPNSLQWLWQHQLLLSASLLCLGIAHIFIRDQEIDSASGRQPYFIASVSLVSCAVAILNCIFMLGGSQFIVLRASSMTGMVTDFFILLGSSLRSRSGRYLWKVRLYAIATLCFLFGGVTGALIDGESTLSRSHSLVVIIMMLAPLWILGAIFLVHQRSKHCFAKNRIRLMRISSLLQPRASAKTTPGSAVSSPPPTRDARADAQGSQTSHETTFTLQQLILRATDGSDCSDELETEGLGLLINRLPRINVLETNFTMFPDHELAVDIQKCLHPAVPGEYETFRYLHFAWVAYLPFVAGALNAIALQGIFRLSIAVTGAITSIGIELRYPPCALAGPQTFSTVPLLCFVLAYGLACSVCGFIVTMPSATGRHAVRRLDYANIKEWRWKHQAMLSLCILSLCTAYGIARSFIGIDKDFAGTINYQAPGNAAFLFAFSCSAFAAGILNAFSSLGRRITLRSVHISGTINDIFLGLGFALRTRSLRFIWRVRALCCNLISFFTGAVIGSVIFHSSWGASALAFPIMMLTPLWLTGIGMLIARRRKHFA